MDRILNFLAREDGPTAVEYAVMLALIIGICLASIGGVGNPVKETYTHSNDQINTKFSESGVD